MTTKPIACALSVLTVSAALALAAPAARPGSQEPDRVTVQHILVAFQGSLPKPTVTRTREEAWVLVGKILEKVRKGDDFDALVKEYTDDEHPGIYSMVNAGVDPDPAVKEFRREQMVKGFGDVSFGLKVGEVGLATYDPQTSKYGWHVIKRLR